METTKIIKYGVIDSYNFSESSLRSIFITHFFSRIGHPCFSGYFGVKEKPNIKNLSTKWDKKLFNLSTQKNYAIEEWSKEFSMLFWFEKDFNTIKYINPKCKNVFFPRDCTHITQEDIDFMRLCSYVAAPTDNLISNLQKCNPPSKCVTVPVDICYPLLKRNDLKTKGVQTLVILLEDEVTLKHEKLLIMLTVLSELKNINIIFISNKIVPEDDKEILKELKIKAKFMEKICDWDLHRLSPDVDWFVDLRTGSKSGWYLSLFNNADTACIGMDTLINNGTDCYGAVSPHGNILMPPNISNDELMYTIYNTFKNCTAFYTLKKQEGNESFKERKREKVLNTYASFFGLDCIKTYSLN